MMRVRLTRETIVAKASPEPNTGCWLWTGFDNGRGYGRIKYQGVARQAHRLVYELLVGPIAEGLELDHKCRVTFCVNPDHLEPVPHVVNVRRGETGMVNGARQRAKSHCRNGHPYSGENLLIKSNGSRGCKACSRARDAERAKKYEPVARQPKSHCKRGHPLSGPDVKVSGNLRICLICRRERDRKRHRAKP